VAVSPPEALLIADHLQTTCTPDALQNTVARLKAQVAQLAPLSLEAHAEALVPCAFLVEGLCTVYEARPIACRTWTSPDAHLCQQAQTHPWDATISQIDPLVEICAATQIGVAAGLVCSGVSAAYLELRSAVLCALETPRAAERWAQGEMVFRHCKRMDRVNDTLDTIFTEMRTAGRVEA
jgi:Fe-S-cluster containining protein